LKLQEGDIPLTFGQKLKTVRTLRKLYQADLEQLSGVRRDKIIAIEKDDILVPGDDIRNALEAALNLKLDEPEVEAAFLLLAGHPVEQPVVAA
jgi:transcriptional regulator with XRE-family HTH domain